MTRGIVFVLVACVLLGLVFGQDASAAYALLRFVCLVLPALSVFGLALPAPVLCRVRNPRTESSPFRAPPV